MLDWTAELLLGQAAHSPITSNKSTRRCRSWPWWSVSLCGFPMLIRRWMIVLFTLLHCPCTETRPALYLRCWTEVPNESSIWVCAIFRHTGKNMLVLTGNISGFITSTEIAQNGERDVPLAFWDLFNEIFSTQLGSHYMRLAVLVTQCRFRTFSGYSAGKRICSLRGR